MKYLPSPKVAVFTVGINAADYSYIRTALSLAASSSTVCCYCHVEASSSSTSCLYMFQVNVEASCVSFCVPSRSFLDWRCHFQAANHAAFAWTSSGRSFLSTSPKSAGRLNPTGLGSVLGGVVPDCLAASYALLRRRCCSMSQCILAPTLPNQAFRRGRFLISSALALCHASEWL